MRTRCDLSAWQMKKQPRILPTRMNRRLRKGCLGTLLTGAIAVSILIGWSVHALWSKYLLNRATARCSAVDWVSENGYAWLDDSTVFAAVLRDDQKARLLRIDLRRRQTRQIPVVLPGTVEDSGPWSIGDAMAEAPIRKVEGLNIGPSGVLWEDENRFRVIGIETGTKMDVQFPNSTWQAVWSDIPGHVLCWRYMGGETTDFAEAALDHPPRWHWEAFAGWMAGSLIGCFKHAAVFCTLYFDESAPDIYVCPLKRRQGPVRKYPVSLPHGYEGLEVRVSPITGRLLWTLLRHAGPEGYIERLLTRFTHAKSHTELSLWDSALDGSGFHRIGIIPVAPGATVQFGLYAAWLPNGRDVSFVWKDELYTVPVR